MRHGPYQRMIARCIKHRKFEINANTLLKKIRLTGRKKFVAELRKTLRRVSYIYCKNLVA